MLANLSIILKKLQLKINAKKTTILIVDKYNKELKSVISIHGTVIEQVQLFCYLGNITDICIIYK